MNTLSSSRYFAGGKFKLEWLRRLAVKALRIAFGTVRSLNKRGLRGTARQAAFRISCGILRRLSEYGEPVEPDAIGVPIQVRIIKIPVEVPVAIPSPTDWKANFSHFAEISLDALLAGNSTIRFPAVTNPTTSIILVLHNRAELTLACLQALRLISPHTFEIILIDNCSTDRTGELLDRLRGVHVVRIPENIGYPKAVNLASLRARGKYLLLLNNDALVLNNSLEIAERYLESHADVGAIGGRVILLDGTLQEAGCVLWSDGRAAQYGRGEPVNAPQYNFVRRVDYCSAVFLLTPRDLFLRLGRFDEAFSPGYYEDTDYSVRLALHGKSIVYHPDIVSLHYESATSAKALRVGDLIERNRQWFLAKHQWWLVNHFDSRSPDMLAARMRGNGRILLIGDRLPLEHDDSDNKQGRLLRSLIRAGFFVTYIPFHDDCRRPRPQGWPLEVELAYKHNHNELAQFLLERNGYYDAVISPLPELLRRRVSYWPTVESHTNNNIVAPPAVARAPLAA